MCVKLWYTLSGQLNSWPRYLLETCHFQTHRWHFSQSARHLPHRQCRTWKESKLRGDMVPIQVALSLRSQTIQTGESWKDFSWICIIKLIMANQNNIAPSLHSDFSSINETLNVLGIFGFGLSLWVCCFGFFLVWPLIPITLEIMWHYSASQNKTSTVLRSNGSIITSRSILKLFNFPVNHEMLVSRCKNFVPQKSPKKQQSPPQHRNNNECSNLSDFLTLGNAVILRQQYWYICSFKMRFSPDNPKWKRMSSS